MTKLDVIQKLILVVFAALITALIPIAVQEFRAGRYLTAVSALCLGAEILYAGWLVSSS